MLVYTNTRHTAYINMEIMHDFRPKTTRHWFMRIQGIKSIYDRQKVNTEKILVILCLSSLLSFVRRNRKMENLINFRFIMDINFTTQIHFTQFLPSLNSIGTIFHLTKHSIDYLSNPI